jgi:hypothetical protein
MENQKIPTALKAILIIAGIVLMIMLIASLSRGSETTHPVAPIPSRSQALPTPQPTLPPTTPAGPLTTFGEGVWEVGVDIVPGKYKTGGDDGGVMGCYYARKKTGDDSSGDILGQDYSHGPITVTIKDSDGYFDTSGCQDWVLQ